MSEQSKLEQERDRLAEDRFPWPYFCAVHPNVLFRRNDFKAGFDAATEIHQERIAKLEEALKFYANQDTYEKEVLINEKLGFWMLPIDGDRGDRAIAALQEDGK